VRTKDPCWSVGTIYDPSELPGVSTAGPRIGRGVRIVHLVASKDSSVTLCVCVDSVKFLHSYPPSLYLNLHRILLD
jgi:hypothetical protein